MQAATKERASGDWRHLPHDPVRFFGLPREFDHKDLKRAYGALIREFKPETHPAEFQRIREAYEQLDNRLRYGVQQKTMQSQAAAWKSAVTAAPGGGRIATAPRSVTDAAIADPRGTYEALRAQEVKSAQEYFVLAMLTDVLQRSDNATFLKWLLAGLKDHPADAGLLGLLVEHLRSDVTEDEAGNVLRAVARAAPAELFFSITESLWERLLRARPFEEFRAVLASCEERLKTLDERYRAVFYLRILRAAMWKADDEWIDAAVRLVEKNGAWLQGRAEFELEFVLQLREYHRHDRLTIGQHRARQQIDAMIEAYCSGDWRTVASSVATTQDSLARDSYGLMEAFPMDPDRDGKREARLVTICIMIAEDVAPQPDADIDGALESMAQKQAMTTLRDIADSLGGISSQITWLERRTFWLPLVCLLVMPVFLLGLFNIWFFLAFFTVWQGAVAGVFFVVLKPNYLNPRFERKRAEIFRGAYDENWRPRLFRYVQACGQTGRSIERLMATAHAAGAGEWMSVILGYAETDAALYLFARAQTFVR